jgi:hypothetical protein
MLRRAEMSPRALGASLFVAVAVGTASAQEASPPPVGAREVRTVTVGPEFNGGGAKRKILGEGYRDLWTTPVRLEVLDLQKEGDGLTPVRQVGQAQSLGLALRGADGRAYTFRSLHKEPERMLPEALRAGVPGYVVRDMTSATHPAAGVVFSALADAVGVPHTWPRLVVMPDDPALGKFQKTFAGHVGTIEEYPLPRHGETPGFEGATEIISSTEMWKRWMAGPENTADARAYLRARVIELLVDNYDRHRGQWRWMRVPGKDAWQPLPEDADFVFIHRDGLAMSVIRRQVPQFMLFSDRYPRRLDGALNHGAEMDRWMFATLTAQDFAEEARAVQSRLTDEVLDRALRRMPPEWYALGGARTLSSLRARVAGLVEYLARVYRYHAHDVDIHATNLAEHVTVARAADDSVDVSIAARAGGGQPYYRRRFVASETDEVRIFLHGGDDRVERSGKPGGPVTVRVIAGGGLDTVDDSKSGGTDVWRDEGRVDVDRGPGTHVRNDSWDNPAPVKDAPWIEPRSWGHWSLGQPAFGFAPDVLVYLGYGVSRTAWGFRTLPNKSEQTIQGSVATGELTGQVEYAGIFRRPGSRLGYRFDAYASGLKSYNYFGSGNETPHVIDRNVYKTRETVVSFSPALHYEAGKRWDASIGPSLRYSRTPTESTTIVGSQAPLGVGRFGQVALRAGLSFDSREEPYPIVNPDVTNVSATFGSQRRVNGLRFEGTSFVVPGVWDATATYGGVDGFVTGYVGSERASLALRAGGRRLWGDYPWFDAAYIGGLNNRGYNTHRFAGDASAYGNASLEVWVGTIDNRVIPIRAGLVAFGDAGRVWLDGEHSKTWHTSAGGGLLLQPAGVPAVVNALVAHSREGTRLYFGFGYPF